MKKTRVAVIGAGYMGKFHAEKLAACERAELAAVIDADGARARAIGAALGAPHDTDYRAWLGRIEAACIAVPTELHDRVARACLEAGVHVLVEKPLARTLEEADTLLAAARAKRLVLQVGHLALQPCVPGARRTAGPATLHRYRAPCALQGTRHGRGRHPRPHDPRP